MGSNVCKLLKSKKDMWGGPKANVLFEAASTAWLESCMIGKNAAATNASPLPLPLPLSSSSLLRHRRRSPSVRPF